MRPTSPGLLLSLAGIAGVTVWALVGAWTAAQGLPFVPWSAAAIIWAAALAIAIAALVLRPRLRRTDKARPLSPFAAARLAALALASSRTGALLVGGYLGYAVVVLGNLDNEYRRRALAVAAVSAVGSAVLIGAGLLLERFCRIPPPPPQGTPHATE
jgi:hypothetical protein